MPKAFTAAAGWRVAWVGWVLALVSVVAQAAPAEAGAGPNAAGAEPGGSPAGVVTAQMVAMSEWRGDPTAAARVFALASEANRAVSGPIDRFRAMVESRQYAPLLDNRGWVVGRAVSAGDAAAVLVTLVTPAGELRAFRFFLSRQPSEGGEWRTDAVLGAAIEDGTPAI